MNLPHTPTPQWIYHEAADAFGFAVDLSQTAQELSGGFQHDVWRVSTTLGNLVLKRQDSAPNPLSLSLEECAEGSGVGTAGIVYTDTGEGWQEFSGPRSPSPASFVRAHYHQDAQSFGREFVSPGLGYLVGTELARLHRASEASLQNDQRSLAIETSVLETL